MQFEPRRNEPIKAVRRAFTSIQGATEAGTSLNQLRDLLQTAVSELANAKKDAGPEHAVAVKHYQEALDIYLDSARFWEADIRFYSRSDNRNAYGGGLPVDMVGVGNIVDRWRIPTRKSDIWGINRGVPRDAGLSHLWRLADEQIKLAEAPPAPTPTDAAASEPMGQQQ